jgi:hypothetical protein
VESLNNSLVFFTQHIRTPISDLLALAEKTDSGDAAGVARLLAMIRKEGGEILATLEGLQDEVTELQGRGERLKQGDLSVAELEKKLRKHLRNGRKRQEKPARTTTQGADV